MLKLAKPNLVSVCLLSFTSLFVALQFKECIEISLSTDTIASAAATNASLLSIFKSTPRSQITTLEDIHFTVKTTRKYFESRIELLLKTWIKLVAQQVYIVTDVASVEIRKRLKNHIVITRCPRSHDRDDLCCKLGAEYDSYMNSDKKWWCRFDDDVYVNLEGLLALLNQYDPDKDFIYIGRQPEINGTYIHYHKVRYKMFFVTGAGVCISRILANDLKLWMSNGNFTRTCADVERPDDVTLGFVITQFLNKTALASDLFHTHLEKLKFTLHKSDYKKQVTFSYQDNNVVRFTFTKPTFNAKVDPTRLLSLHCLYYPNDEICTDTS